MPSVDLVELASAYWRSFALTSGVELGVFTALAERRDTAADLAEALSCSSRHLEALLDSLAGLGVLEKSGALYGLHPDQRDYLDPASPDCMLEAFRFNSDLAGLWMKLPDCVREGKPVLPGNPHLGEDPDRTRRFVRGMHSRAGLMARGLLPYLRPSAGSRILDVGGGPGTFSLKLAERDPSLEITVLDLPPIVAAAEEIHRGNPALASIQFHGGDYHAVAFPEEQDLVLYCGALHQEPEEGLLPLLTRMREALTRGGALVVVDLMLDPGRATPVYSALFELNMMLMRPTSRVYTHRRVEELLVEAGLGETKTSEIPGTPYRMVRAVRG